MSLRRNPESDELTKAEQELEDLELNYMKGLFGANVSPEVITKVANGNIDSFSQLQAKVTDMQNRLEAAKKRVEECQKNVDDLTLQSTKDTNNAGVSTKNEELTKDQATTDLTEAQNRFEKDKAATIASLNAQITELTSQISDLEKLLASTGTTGGTGTAQNSFFTQKATAVGNLYDKMKSIYDAASADSGITLTGPGPGTKDVSDAAKVQATLLDAKKVFEGLQKDINAVPGKADSYITLFADYNAALLVVQNIEQNASDINKNYGDQQTSLASKKADLANLQKKLAAL